MLAEAEAETQSIEGTEGGEEEIIVVKVDPELEPVVAQMKALIKKSGMGAMRRKEASKWIKFTKNPCLRRFVLVLRSV